MSTFAQRVLKVVLMLICVMFLCSCRQQGSAEETDTGRKPVIGFSLATLKEDRWLRDRDIFIAKAKQAGYDVMVKHANNDSQLQFEQVNDMIAEGIDVLVIAPQDSDDAARCVNAAKKAGIPVVSYDRLVLNANVDAYVSFDVVEVGQLMAEALVSEVPEGGYIIVCGAENDHNSKLYYSGYMSVLSRSKNAQKIDVIAETWVEDWRREGAFDFVSKVLRENGDKVHGIIAGNDSLAWGAIDAISVARLTGKIKVVGHDADLAACQRIVEGTQLATIYKPIKNLVEATLEVCDALLKDEPFSYNRTINDGTYDIPYVMLDVILVTKDNIDDTVIKDGFHLKKDIYRNLDE